MRAATGGFITSIGTFRKTKDTGLLPHLAVVIKRHTILYLPLQFLCNHSQCLIVLLHLFPNSSSKKLPASRKLKEIVKHILDSVEPTLRDLYAYQIIQIL